MTQISLRFAPSVRPCRKAKGKQGSRAATPGLVWFLVKRFPSEPFSASDVVGMREWILYCGRSLRLGTEINPTHRNGRIDFRQKGNFSYFFFPGEIIIEPPVVEGKEMM